MRTSITLLAVGELLALVGLGWWWPPLALMAAGGQCVALGLLRMTPDQKAQGLGRHHRPTSPARRRGPLRLVPTRWAS